MRKIILTIALVFSIAGAVYIYNSLITSINNEIREDTQDISKNAVKINFMHWAYFPEEIFKRFNEKYPGIIVDYEQINEHYYHDTQKLRIVSGDKIDIMGILRNDFEDFVIRGYLTDLSEKHYMNNYERLSREEIRSLALSRREYAIPYQSYVFGIWYNKILFNKYNIEIPRNYTEFVEVCRKFKKYGITPLILGARDEWAGSYVYLLRLCSLQSKENSWLAKIQNGEAKWDDVEVRNVFKDISYLIREEYIPRNSLGLTYYQAFAEFLKGKSAMVIASDSSINLARQDIENVCDPGVFAIPYNLYTDSSKVPGGFADLLTGIFSKSKNKDEADLFLEHLSQIEIAQIFCDANMTFSTIKGVDTSKFKYGELWEPLRKMPRFTPPSKVMEYEFLKLFNKSAKDLLAGNKGYIDILNEFQKLQEKMMHKNYN